MKFVLFDRVRKAGDNAEYFYRYLKQSHPDLELKYILDSASSDWQRLTKDKFNLVDINNPTVVQHEINTATYVCGSYLPYHTIKGIKVDNTFIFLNHGCFFRKSNYLVEAKFDLMLAGNKLEYDTLIDLYKFPASKIALTGQPRQDSLINNNTKYTGPTNNILIQFWWRPWLNKTNFEQSEFYQNISMFLNDKRLNYLAKEYNVNFLLKLHCEMEKYSNMFKKFVNVTLIPNNALFEPLFIKSSLLITDFTSNVYEMGMINKPCLYYEPDWATLNKELTKYGDSMFDIKTRGIGPFTNNLDSLFEELEKIIKHNYKLDSKYINRRHEQITFAQDSNCCKRAYEAIIKVAPKTKIKKQDSQQAYGQNNSYLYF